MSRAFDPRLYLVTARSLLRGRDWINVILAAVRGGVTLVQLREKHLDTRRFTEEARLLKTALTPHGVPLIINDRIDVALASGADGIHLGRRDMLPADARRLMGPNALIGLSLESMADAQAVLPSIVDYVAASPVFPTPTKTDTAAPLGIAGIRKIRELVSLPLVGIGGIHSGNVREVIEAGADGIAVISAILAADDPEQAARQLRTLLS
ncbi:MAG: thiamine phosphate synthase [Kiritimatiellae bacterium]|nr:thiamine phosphate synthase [Kiritimatiellia bacterium]